MLLFRPLPVTFALLIASAASAHAAGNLPAPDPAKQAPDWTNLASIPQIEFYLAKGEADACGPGCSEWIAAEGKIDAGAASRLRRLLAKLPRPRPPLLFHSPGGLVEGGLELGRLFREQKLEVSVAHTIALGCDRDKPAQKSCEAQKRSGTAIEARLDPFVAMCNSSCVYALAGGSARRVPPLVKLGIHDVGFDPGKAPSGAVAREAKTAIHERLRGYLREMGIDEGLLKAASAVPFESKRFLERDEVARLGIDRRDFAETGWQLVDKPAPMLVKGYFARTDNDRVRYLDGFVTLACRGVQFGVVLARQHAGAAFSGSRPLSIDLNGRQVDLSNQSSSQDLDLYAAVLRGGVLDDVSDDATLGLSAADLARDEAAGGATLDMRGFSAAYAKLRQSCEISARTAPDATSTWLRAVNAASQTGKAGPSGNTFPQTTLPSFPATKGPLGPPTRSAAPRASPSSAGATAPAARPESVRPACSAQIADAPAHLTGRVTRFVSADEASSRVQSVEDQLGAKISPAYASLNRVVVERYPQGDNWSTMAAVPRGVAVKIGDLVELNGRYRDQSLPCHFIPWTIDRVVDHVE